MILDKVIASGLILFSGYMISHAVLLPIGWHGETGGPGGGAFPFWTALIVAVCAAVILLRPTRQYDEGLYSFDRAMIGSVIQVIIAIAITIALIPVTGAYVAIPLFLFWYLKIFGKHSWTTSLSITVLMPIGIFLFFEVALKILLPKGMTEPLFFPLYAIFF